MPLDYSSLTEIVGRSIALTYAADLVPVDVMPETEVFRVVPPTYAPLKDHAPSRYLISERGEVRLDSPQSWANRLEEIITAAALTPSIDVVKPDGTVLVNSRALAHRIFDAYLRDSLLGEKPFFADSVGTEIRRARPEDATQVFIHSPESLLFGAWDSHTGGGALVARYPRLISGRIYGVGAQTRPGGAQKTDALGVNDSAGTMYKRPDGMLALNPDEAETTTTKDGKKNPVVFGKNGKPSEAGYGSVPASTDKDGVDVTSIHLTGAIHLGAMRKYHFPTDKGKSTERDLAACAALAALAVYAVAQAVEQGLPLRSGCDLVPTRMAWLVRRGLDGDSEIEIKADDAKKVLKNAIAKLDQYGLGWNQIPLQVVASDGLIHAIANSVGEEQEE
ncbi:MAG: type I-U CRISPR-associated RAMP protein Csb1/Cas7u [Methylococcaceae bacterium]|nr:type I-U CRISPR-associated RAMP protein Csb1/Cas7u [Methylococcaceae bacterium]